jgi:hypothetical protein
VSRRRKVKIASGAHDILMEDTDSAPAAHSAPAVPPVRDVSVRFGKVAPSFSQQPAGTVRLAMSCSSAGER